ncbi:hypothetical protein [Thiothrix subterranea]|uniref:hypothetical protein n=1 Tax=Thiothrix subterranea TaxID=2735563 RepID=UPI00280B4332|nr:hypothetical protein [Thiothrix subterranea]
MSISLRHLFAKHGLEGMLISIRNSLKNHPNGEQMSMRSAHGILFTPVSGNGFLRGCRDPNSVRIDLVPGLVNLEVLRGVLPSWVPIAGNTNLLAGNVDHIGETRVVEGILTESKISGTDFPFKPWHLYYDWNFHVKADPQYTYLLSATNIQDKNGDFECEWDTSVLPQWAWPQTGNRICIIGRWIYDCGHPTANGHKTEIHPPKAIAWFRWEAIKFAQNVNAVRANIATIYLGSKGGYWDQPINNQDYTFDLYLPNKIHVDSVPIWNIIPKTSLPVFPVITPYPNDDPKLLRITIPLKGSLPTLEEYGVIVSGGWSDPHGIEALKSKHLRIVVNSISIEDNEIFQRDEWYIYIGINGRWNFWKNLDSGRTSLDFILKLDLYSGDFINITACGFEADEVDNIMGKDIGLSWTDVSNSSKLEQNAKKIRNGFLSGIGAGIDPNMENESDIGTISILHSPDKTGVFTVSSNKNIYSITYKVEVA